MKTMRTVSTLLFLCLVIAGRGSAQEETTPSTSPEKIGLPFEIKKWTGDFDDMVKRRVIRALVVYSKTYYFVDKGVQRGTAYEALKAFEDEINKKLKTKAKDRVHVMFITVPRDDLIPGLLEGRGDVAAAGLTITPEREKLAAFSAPLWDDVSEIPVTAPDGPQLSSAEDLSGQEVFARKSSSYWEHLERLNERFAKEGKPPVILRASPESLEDEDILEMVNAGLVKITVVDSHAADFWKRIYTQITPYPGAAVNTGGQIAWMFRKESPKLKQAVDEFVRTHGKGTAFGNELARRYFKSTKMVKSATAPGELQKFRQLVEMFRKYGEKYDLDYLLIMA